MDKQEADTAAAYQTNDGERYAAAEDFYFQSGLDEMETPLYLDYLKTHRSQEYQKIKEQIGANSPTGEQGLYHQIEHDAPFLDLLEKGQLAYGDSFEKKRHQMLRQEYHGLKKKIISLYYGFQPARPRLETWLTS